MPLAKSSRSTSAVDRPRDAASSATPAPVMPPPITSTSKRSCAEAPERVGAIEGGCHMRLRLPRSLAGPSGPERLSAAATSAARDSATG